MNNIKNYAISIGYILIIILVLAIILTIFNYYDILTGNFFKVIKVLIPSAAMFFGGLKIGSKANSRGYLEGIKLGIVFIFILFLFGFLGFNTTFNINLILYYIILLLSSMLGAMIGINKKTINE